MTHPTPGQGKETRVINSKFAPKGWREDPQFVDIRRTRGGRVSYAVVAEAKGYFGNPFPVTEGMPLPMALGLFREYAEYRIKHDPMFREMVASLVGKTLVCACAPKRGLTSIESQYCHGQILAELAEALSFERLGGGEP